jgi:hypothetical protein
MELRKFIATTIREYLNEQQILNEASFHSFDNDDILNDKYIKNFINSEDVADNLLDWYIESNDLDEEDKETIRLSQDYYEYIKDVLYRLLEDAKENIYDKIDYHSNKITLFRAITVDDNWLQHLKTQGKRLGIYWSWCGDGAVTHWGDYSKKNEAIIEVDIDEKYVDWKTTFEMNMHPNYSDEKEIRLFKNTPIQIKSIKINHKEIDISILGNKVFYS